MNRRSHRIALVASFTSALLFGACGGSEDDGAEEFRQAVPSRSLLAMDVPAPEAKNDSAGQKTSALLGAQADLYKLTYDVSRKVNGTIWVGLHTVDSIVKHPPTKVGPTAAVWGPIGDALEPLTWMLLVERKGPTTYNYVLSARKRNTQDTFTPILAGSSTRFPTGYKGLYTANADALRGLDPANHDGTGKLIATYDTTQGERSVKLALEGYTNDQGEISDALYRYLARADRSGEFRFVTLNDMVTQQSQPGTTAQEIVAVASNWTATGAGRGDATISGGDLQKGDFVHLTECWDTSFGRVYYKDSKDLDPQEGDVTQCAFDKALPSE